METEKIYYTPESIEKIYAEVQRLKEVERPAAAQAISEAVAKGDLRENSEYHAAKARSQQLEEQIARLELEIGGATIVEKKNIGTKSISLFNKVTVHYVGTDKRVVYTLVPAAEAELKTGKISVNSPIGKALVGKKKGDQVKAKIPAGELLLSVVEIAI